MLDFRNLTHITNISTSAHHRLFSAINGRVLVLIYIKTNEYNVTTNNYNDKVKMILRSRR